MSKKETVTCYSKVVEMDVYARGGFNKLIMLMVKGEKGTGLNSPDLLFLKHASTIFWQDEKKIRYFLGEDEKCVIGHFYFKKMKDGYVLRFKFASRFLIKEVSLVKTYKTPAFGLRNKFLATAFYKGLRLEGAVRKERVEIEIQ